VTYLIDTNVISEFQRKAPAARVIDWLNERPASSLYLSVLTIGEIRKGIETDADPSRRLRLLDWLEVQLPAFFAGRVLSIDTTVAQRWGQLVADAGRPLPAIDSLLAATALAYGMVLVTRNTKDVDGLGLQVFNPWAP
jgi:predicted nucleic acid-binding protein